MAERIETLDSPTWFLQPGDRITQSVVEELLAIPVMVKIFGDRIVPYKRMDFGAREFPALRVYSPNGSKAAETWYLNGDVRIDVIFPASLRRDEQQRFPDLVTSALLAVFRAQPFFEAVKAKVPGLNQLGWNFSYDKDLGFIQRDAEDINPLTQITLNYRVNLNEWDEYLESDDRTPEQPFEKTLADLEKIYVELQAKDDDNATADTVDITVKQ